MRDLYYRGHYHDRYINLKDTIDSKLTPPFSTASVNIPMFIASRFIMGFGIGILGWSTGLLLFHT